MDEQFLKNLRETDPKEIRNSYTIGSKYYNLRQKVLENTDYFPYYIGIEKRIEYILSGATGPKLCECGCGHPTKNPLIRFIHGHGNKSQTIKDAKKQTTLEHFGVDNPSKSNIIKEKKKQISQEKYGSTCYFDSKEGKQRYREEMIKHYGVDNPFKTEKIKKQVKERWKNNKEELSRKIQQEEWRLALPKIIERINDRFTLLEPEKYQGVKKTYKFQCKKCNNIFFDNINNGYDPRCYICNPPSISLHEQEIIDYLKSFNLLCDVHNRSIIAPHELDVFIPSLNLAIEYNSLYYHSDRNESIDSKYHLQKTEQCNQKNIRLIQIFSDEYEQKRKIIFSRIRNIIGKNSYSIGARKCEIKFIDNKLKNKFLLKYHIQGSDCSNIRLGLFYRNRLVAVMTFGNLRKALGSESSIGSYELYRYCTIPNFTIVGGAGKLLTYFEKQYHPKSLITYADRRWSDGNLYWNLGFQLDHISSPNYWYTDNFRERYYRYAFRKSELLKKLPYFDPQKTEAQNMRENGYYKIWDCGNFVFHKEYWEQKT